MRRRGGGRIAVVCEPHPHSFLRVLRGISLYLQGQAGWELQKWFANDPDLTGNVRREKVDGIVARVRSAALAEQLRAVGCPVVSVYDDLPQRQFPCVMLNQPAIGRMGAEYLMDWGFKRLLFVGANERWSREREQSFGAAVRKRMAGEAVVGRRVAWEEGRGEEMAQNLLRRLARPVAIMAANDRIGVHLLEACHGLHLRVPEEVAVLGVDNDENLCEFAPTPLSSIDTNLEGLGFSAARLLHEVIQGTKPPEGPLQVDPRDVVSRRSTDILTVSDRDLQKAIQFIQARACDGIDVEDVSQAVLISRRMLELRFRRVLGCSPGSEIRRVRVQRAAQLLRQTDLKLVEIAADCGYAHRTHLTAEFKHHFGLSPKEYRQRIRQAGPASLAH